VKRFSSLPHALKMRASGAVIVFRVSGSGFRVSGFGFCNLKLWSATAAATATATTTIAFLAVLFGGHSVVIQWSFSGHSVVIQWSFGGHSVVIRWSFNGHSVVSHYGLFYLSIR
jgi:hypothetical protein